MSIRDEEKRRFIHALAEYLVGDQAQKGVELSLGKPSGEAWAKLRGTTPLIGYPSVDEAERQLTEFLA